MTHTQYWKWKKINRTFVRVLTTSALWKQCKGNPSFIGRWYIWVHLLSISFRKDFYVVSVRCYALVILVNNKAEIQWIPPANFKYLKVHSTYYLFTDAIFISFYSSKRLLLIIHWELKFIFYCCADINCVFKKIPAALVFKNLHFPLC